SEDRTARLWDAAAGKEVAVLRASQQGVSDRVRQQVFGPVQQASFSPDGRRVLTVALDPQVCLVTKVAGQQSARTIVPFTPARHGHLSSRTAGPVPARARALNPRPRPGEQATAEQLPGRGGPAEKGSDRINFPGMRAECGIDRARFSANGRRLLTVENGCA